MQNDERHGIAGHQWYVATRLTGGRVGVRGIELHYKAEDMTDISVLPAPLAGSTYTIRSFVEYSRLAVLEGGLMSIMNA